MRKLPIALAGALAAGSFVLAGSGLATATPAPAKVAATGHGPVTIDQPLRDLAKRNSLIVGTAVNTDALAEDAPYKKQVTEQFNGVTAENVMKWEVLEPERGVYDWTAADELVKFAQQNKQTIHGHVLVWHSQLPAWLTEGYADGSISDAEVKKIVKNHITTVVKRYKGKIASWDVVNEMITDGDNPQLRDSIFLQALGENYIADALRWAHAADPRATLYLNDYATDNINPKSTAYYELAKKLLKQRVPLGGIGFQAHLDLQYPLPIDMPQNIARFGKLGLKTAITEADVRFDLPVDNWKTAAQVGSFNTLLQACLLNTSCERFTLWGFSDKYSWIPDFSDGRQGSATPSDENFAPKPAWYALQQVLALSASTRKH